MIPGLTIRGRIGRWRHVDSREDTHEADIPSVVPVVPRQLETRLCDIGGPFAFVFSLSMLSHLIALLCGELALVGDGVSDAARRAPRA